MDATKASALQYALTDLLDVSMVTRYVIVAEVISDDGSQSLADLTSPGLPYWDFTGMLTFALQGREAQPMWSARDDE